MLLSYPQKPQGLKVTVDLDPQGKHKYEMTNVTQSASRGSKHDLAKPLEFESILSLEYLVSFYKTIRSFDPLVLL